MINKAQEFREFLNNSYYRHSYAQMVKVRCYLRLFLLLSGTVLITAIASKIPFIQAIINPDAVKRGDSLVESAQHFQFLSDSKVLIFLVLPALVIALASYLFIDYRAHHAPLVREDPNVSYKFTHHLRVITLPMIRYKQKPLTQILTFGSMLIAAMMVTMLVSLPKSFAYAPDEFVTTWKTDNPGVSGNNQITIPTNPGGVYNYDVDWGDSSTSTGQTGNSTHTYASAGTYTVKITGTFSSIFFAGGGDSRKILTVEQWGNNHWTYMGMAFSGASNLTIPATDTPDLSGVTNSSYMFENCTSFNQPIDDWDVSHVTDMSFMFSGASSFNQPLNSWDVSHVTSFDAMFRSASSFNQPLNNWVTSSLQGTSYMFNYATSFNQDIGGWDMNDVTSIRRMFMGATAFNQNISSWDMVGITDVSFMFYNATNFNQPLNAWNMSTVTNMRNLFYGTTHFNQPLDTWDTSNVTNMDWMFSYATVFDQDISSWDTGSVGNMYLMFYHAEVFNSPLNTWDVSNVTNIQSMFQNAYAFNQPLDQWDIGNVTSLYQTFAGASSFNQNINSWNTISVTDMQGVFVEATSFNQPLNNWVTSNVVTMFSMFAFMPNFNQPLDTWDTSNVTNMNQMFAQAPSFNQPLNTWNLSNVIDLDSMFSGATSFNQSLASWDVSSVSSMYNMFGNGAGVSSANYDATLISWSSQLLQNNVQLTAGTSKYCNAIAERASLISTYNWTITDGGLQCDLAPNEFVTTWKTDNPGFSASNQIRIPIGVGVYNYDVDWGDSSTSTGLTAATTHTYASPGTYTVKITGTFPHMYFGDGQDNNKILSVEQWGTNPWQELYRGFYNCSHLVVNATDTPNLSGVTSLWEMFFGATSFNSNINTWDVSTIDFMANMFAGATSFNQPLNSWDVSLVTSFTGMFNNATSFNQPLNNWDTSNATDMLATFQSATAFNSDISTWDTTNVTNMFLMFAGATAFNQPIGSWNVSNVTDMYGMFSYANSFNQPLSSWVVTGLTSTQDMFLHATAFNQPIGSWNVSGISNMQSMFYLANSFDQSLAGWNVSNVTNMTSFFSITSGLSTPNYDATLTAWNGLSLQPGVTLNAGTSTFCTSESDRANMISSDGWTITDNGKNCPVDTTSFITTWKTDNPGVSASDQITIPTYSLETYNYDVDWGDSSSSTGQTGDATHTYASAGTYTVKITGTFPRIYFNESGDAQKILTVEQWGSNPWTSMSRAFGGASNLTIPATDAPDLSAVTSLSRMFIYATSLNSDLSSWDTGNVEDMSQTFQGATSFNQPLNSWDVGSVTYISGMFNNATSFNQPLYSWDVSLVENMNYMFDGASAFNQDLSNWNTSSCLTMYSMFSGATSFNGDITTWNVSNVTDFGLMFIDASSFNQNLNAWNTSSATSLRLMFAGATSFNQSLASWNVTNVTNINGIFSGATSFNQSLASWNVSNVLDMTNMFASGSGLSTANYDATLTAWNALTLQNGVTFDAGTSTYCSSVADRANMISSDGWTINDSGESVGCGGFAPDEFVTTWKTDNPGESDSNQISIPAYPFESYNYDVDWGDGNTTTGEMTFSTHTYASPGTYTVKITGLYPRITTDIAGDREKLLSVEQWGSNHWSSMSYAFAGASNLSINATDTPDLSGVTDMSFMFQSATNFDSDISTWNVSNVTNMEGMYHGANAFNQPLNSWNVSNVTNMDSMFAFTDAFNQPLSSWDVSNVTNMASMFYWSNSFNQSLNSWVTNSLTTTRDMFSSTASYSQPMDFWNTTNITDMSNMFSYTTNFNQPLNSWNVSNVSDMTALFAGANSFNQPLNSWNVSNVSDMTALFAGANSFNQTLNSWDVSSVTHMPMMFADISFFTPASPGIVFNQPLNSWNVSNVTDMQGMFLGAENYNQSLASWNVSNVTDMTYMFGDAGGLAPASSGLSTANYDATLTAWNALTLQNGVTFDAGTSTYCSSVADRANMISSDGWTINDSGENCGATALTATINQSIGQQDPTSTNPITYTVVFSEAIDPSTFTQDDLWLSSGSGNIADLTTSDNITWNVTVNANSPGYFTLQLQEQRVQTMGGTFNEAATSTDNTVSFQYLQTDFSLVKTLSTAGEIKNGDSVTYHFKIKNEGPNDSFYSGVVYDVLPLEFTFESNTNPLVTCSDMGLAEDLGEPYFAYHFSGHHMLACMPVNGGSDTLTNGSSIEFDITGTASGNYITNSTTNKSVYFDVSSRENDAMLVMNNAFSNNIDLTTLPINNVSNAVYTWSPAVPTPDPTPTPDPAPTPTTSTPTKPKTPRTPANPNTPATAPTNTENSPSVSNPVALEKLEEPDLPKEVLGRRTGLPLLIYNTFHGFSDTVAKIITWLPLIALIVIALLYSYRARREYKTLLYLQRVISRYRGTKEAIANYSNITTHYLNTPVAIMNGAVELLASLKKLPDWAITHLGTILKSYSADVVKLSSLSQVAASPQTLGVSIAGPIAVVNDVQYSATNAKKSAIKQKAVWLPIAISFAALALASALFVYADVYALNTVQLMLQIFCLVLVSGLVIFSYHNKVVQLAAQAVAKQTIQAEQALIASRTKFLKQAGDVLSEHYNNFVLATKDFKFIPETKTLFGGLAMLGELTKSINNTYSLTSLSSDSPMQKLAQEIPKVVNDLKPAIDAKHIKVTTDIDTDASATLQPAELKQLIGSVVANAVQYSPDGGEIKIAAKNSGNKAVISVTDHGQGMTADKLMRLFEPFNKATSTETYDHQGLGLSLHTDKLITEKLGGKIEVASKTDAGTQGTTVTITLPIGETSPLKAPVLISPATA